MYNSRIALKVFMESNNFTLKLCQDIEYWIQQIINVNLLLFMNINVKKLYWNSVIVELISMVLLG